MMKLDRETHPGRVRDTPTGTSAPFQRRTGGTTVGGRGRNENDLLAHCGILDRGRQRLVATLRDAIARVERRVLVIAEGPGDVDDGLSRGAI